MYSALFGRLPSSLTGASGCEKNVLILVNMTGVGGRTLSTGGPPFSRAVSVSNGGLISRRDWLLAALRRLHRIQRIMAMRRARRTAPPTLAEIIMQVWLHVGPEAEAVVAAVVAAAAAALAFGIDDDVLVARVDDGALVAEADGSAFVVRTEERVCVVEGNDEVIEALDVEIDEVCDVVCGPGSTTPSKLVAIGKMPLNPPGRPIVRTSIQGRQMSQLELDVKQG